MEEYKLPMSTDDEEDLPVAKVEEKKQPEAGEEVLSCPALPCVQGAYWGETRRLVEGWETGRSRQ